MGDDPINLSDPSGGSIGGLPCPGTSGLSIFLDNVVYSVSSLLSKASPVLTKINYFVNATRTAIVITRAIEGASVINKSIKTQPAGAKVSGSNAEQEGNTPQPTSEPQNNYPIFEAEKNYPDIQRIDLLYWEMAPPNQKTIIGNKKYLIFRYEADKTKQDKNGQDARKTNPLCFTSRGFAQECHEVPYKSTMEGGAGSIMAPTNAGQNAGHGASLMWFYKTLTPGAFFLVPVGEVNNKPRDIPIPVFVPKTETKAIPKPQTIEFPKKLTPIPAETWLAPVIWSIIAEYWWVVFVL